MTDHTVGTREEWLAARKSCCNARRNTPGWATSSPASAASCPGSRSRRSTASRRTTGRRRSRSSSTDAPSSSSTTSCSARLRGGLSRLLVDRRRRQRRPSAPPRARRDDALRLAAPLEKLQAYKRRMGWSFPGSRRTAPTSTSTSASRTRRSRCASTWGRCSRASLRRRPPDGYRNRHRRRRYVSEGPGLSASPSLTAPSTTPTRRGPRTRVPDGLLPDPRPGAEGARRERRRPSGSGDTTSTPWRAQRRLLMRHRP